MRRTTFFILIMVVTATFARASGPPRDPLEIQRAQLYGKLTATRLSVEIDAPCERVFGALAVALDAPIFTRYADHRYRCGIDPAAPIRLTARNRTLLDILEMTIEQCSISDPCTWQLRNGFVEVGPKRRLAATIERRDCDLTDLSLDWSYFASDGGSTLDPLEYSEHPYRPASLDRPGEKSIAETRDEVLEMIEIFIEPGNWHGRDQQGERQAKRFAAVRVQGTRVLITGPNFVHRQLIGTPTPEWPPALSRVELDQRAARATRGGCAITILTTDGVRADAEIDDPELQRRRLHGHLVYTHVDAVFRATPLRACLAELERQTGIPIIGRFEDDGFGYGLDPDRPISFELPDVPLLTAIEAIADSCGSFQDPCTWQLRRGFIEVGTRSRLSLPGAWELRAHDVADLLMHIPEDPTDRRLREVVALDMVETIVETIDPEDWDWGQYEYNEPDETTLRDATPGTPSPTTVTTTIVNAYDERLPHYFVPPTPHSIRAWRDLLIVRGPDYIHRELNGYAEPIPPPGYEGAAPAVGTLRDVGGDRRRWTR